MTVIKRHPLIIAIVAFAGALTLACGALSILGSLNPAQPTPVPAALPSKVVASLPSATPSLAGLSYGQSATLDGMTITVYGTVPMVQDTFTPRPGNRTIILDVAIENHTGKTQQVTVGGNLALVDSTGRRYPFDAYATVATRLQMLDGMLADGELRRGPVGYQAPGDAVLRFTYEPVLNSGRKVTYLVP